jgi:hypothetical protein
VLRLLRLIFVLGGFAALLWFGTTIKLGDRTLFEHIQAIWKTPESQGLVRGAKDKVNDLVDRAAGHVVKGIGKNAADQLTSQRAAREGEPAPAAPPMEEIQAKDRQALRGLIGQAYSEKAE